MFCKPIKLGDTTPQDKKLSLKMATHLVLLCKRALSCLLHFLLFAHIFLKNPWKTAETCHGVKVIIYSLLKKKTKQTPNPNQTNHKTKLNAQLLLNYFTAFPIGHPISKSCKLFLQVLQALFVSLRIVRKFPFPLLANSEITALTTVSPIFAHLH